MAISQFTATAFQNYRWIDSGYANWRTGYPSTDTTALDYVRHPYKSYFFFDTAAIVAALANKAVDSISIALTPGYYPSAERMNADVHMWRMQNCKTMPDNILGNSMADGIVTTTGTNIYFVEQLMPFVLDKSNPTTGVIAIGAAAQRLADSLKEGNALGMFYRGQNEDTTLYKPDGYMRNGGSAAPVITIEYHDATSACGAPTSASLSAGLSEGDVILSFSGATGGINNAITGYEAHYSESDDGANWSAWAAYTINSIASGSGSFPVSPSSTRGRFRKFRLRTLGAAGAGWESAWVETSTVRRNGLPTAPGSLRFHIGGGGYFYSSLQCLWNNGGDPDGNFSGVYIRLARYNHDSGAGAVGWAWLDTDWVWLDNASSLTITRAQLAAKGAKAGDAIAFGLVAQDTLSAQNWDAAGMTASGYVYLAADPAAPSAFTASPSIQESGVTLSWSGANGNGIAIAGYDIEYKTSSTSGGAEGTDGYAAADGSPYSTSYASGSKTDPAVISRGYYERWRIRTRNADGAVSGWAYSNITRKNSAPAAPDVTAPVSLKTIYNSQPRILAAVGSDADAHSQTLAAAGYTASSGGAQAPGRKLVLRKSSAAAAGAQSVSVTSTDIMGVLSSAAARSFTYAVPVWTDPGLTAGETPVKAVHMTELRAAADNVRAYYGMAAYPWAGAITAGITGIAGWTGHVAELRTAIEQVAALVNGWDTTGSTNDIALPAWIAINENRPSAAVIAQLRDVIPLL